MVAKRLHPYFQAHPMTVLTDQPLKAILRSLDTLGRIAKWAIKLSEFDITFKPRSAMKAQILVHFIVECPWETSTRITKSAERNFSIGAVESAQGNDLNEMRLVWTLHVDGASNSNGCGVGLILTDPEGQALDYAL